MQYLSASESSQLLIDHSDVQAIDVREPYEYAHGNCGFRNIPMAEIINQIQTLDSTLTTLILCKSGKRAEAVGNLLETEYDFKDLIIVEGGILAWQAQIDPTISID